MTPAKGLMIVTCVDPRVDPLAVLGLQRGDAAVVRNVGGRVTPSLLQTMAMLRQVGRADGVEAGARLHVVVLQHTDCGITRIRSRELLAGYFGVPDAELDAKNLGRPVAAVREDVAALRANPMLPAGLSVSGIVLDVATGLIETVTSPEPLPAEAGQR